MLLEGYDKRLNLCIVIEELLDIIGASNLRKLL